ncbi:MAG: hypothetical protein JW902_10695 [Syntrophaceae bacterium]|nr:hypothetical protein [Syntrophaceae bacterium]
MESLIKRAKIFMTIAGVVIVLVGFVLLGPGVGDLFAGDVIHVSPTSATINVAESLNMSINSMFICKWSSSDPSTVVITVQDPGGTRNITVQGMKAGSATITAKCAIGNRYATVTVRPPPVISPTSPVVGVGKTLTLSTGNPTCTWYKTRYGMGDISISPTTGASTVVTGVKAGYRGVSADCNNGRGSTSVLVQ